MHTCSFALTTVGITWPRFHDRFLFGSHHFAPCKGIQDRFWILRCGFQVAGLYTGFQCLSVEIGIWIPIVSGIPNSVELYSGFHTQKFSDSWFRTQKFLEFRNPDSFTWGESFEKSEKFTFRNFLRPAVRELYVCQLCKRLMTAHEWKFHSYLNADKLIAKSNHISDTDSCVFGLCFDWVLEVRLPTWYKWWG